MASTGEREGADALGIQLGVSDDASPDEIAQATLQLRRELLELDVEKVSVAGGGDPPAGSRGIELAALGALVVTFARVGVLASVVGAVQSWLTTSSQRSIKLELDGDSLELTGLPSSEQRRLTDEWLKRHEVG